MFVFDLIENHVSVAHSSHRGLFYFLSLIASRYSNTLSKSYFTNFPIRRKGKPRFKCRSLWSFDIDTSSFSARTFSFTSCISDSVRKRVLRSATPCSQSSCFSLRGAMLNSVTEWSFDTTLSEDKFITFSYPITCLKSRWTNS